MTESWLLETGVIPNGSLNTLLMYGYSQYGVEKVNLEIDQDEANSGKSPKVNYKVKLTPSVSIKWQALKKAEKIKNVILRKASVLALIKIGVPIDIKEQITKHAKEYLPAQFAVNVEIVEKI